MKKLIFILLLLPTITFGQNYSINEPRLRVNRSASLALTTSWQTVVFNGTSTFNFNTYPTYPQNGEKFIWYDTSNNIFKLNGEYDRNINLQLFLRVTTTVITTGATVQMRIVVPNYLGPGSDLYFPFPDDGGYIDLIDVTKFTTAQNNGLYTLSIYANSLIRTNGFYIQLRLSNALFGVGTCTINSAAMVILSRY